jgi:hypothetical protein
MKERSEITMELFHYKLVILILFLVGFITLLRGGIKYITLNDIQYSRGKYQIFYSLLLILIALVMYIGLKN